MPPANRFTPGIMVPRCLGSVGVQHHVAPPSFEKYAPEYASPRALHGVPAIAHEQVRLTQSFIPTTIRFGLPGSTAIAGSSWDAAFVSWSTTTAGDRTDVPSCGLDRTWMGAMGVDE